jgi:hypothetical protein
MARSTLGDGFRLNGPDPYVQSESVLYATQYDQVDTTLAYLGEAEVGTPTNAATWRVQKLVFTAGGGVGITWADGDTRFDNVWDSRASLTYI